MSSRKRALNGVVEHARSAKSARKNLTFEEADENTLPGPTPNGSPINGSQKRNGAIGKKRRKRVKTQMTHSIEESDEELLSPASALDKNEADVGIIEKVTLKNFMCHSNLEFEFGPHVNFIVGRNGSGKSAILNGIMLALGSRAANTGRSQNLAGFIQTDKQVAYISVTLRNTGSEAYQYNDYGPRIIVERKLERTGQGPYKLKGANGKLVSMKKDELTNIIEALNIQVENPVSVLTQDASKCFLDSKDPKKKYELFFKATQLEKLWEQYDEAETKRKQASLTLNAKKQVLPEALKEVEKWAVKYKRMEALDNQRGKVRDLQNELAWAIVKDYEEREAKSQMIVEKFKKDLEGVQKKAKECEKHIQSYNEDLKKLKEIEATTKCTISQLRTDHEEAIKTCHRLNREVLALKVKCESFKRKIESIQFEMRNLQKIADEMNQRSQKDLDDERQRREEQLQKLEEHGLKLRRDCKELELTIAQQKEDCELKEQQIVELRSDLENLETRKVAKQIEIRSMNSILSNQEARFGPRMPQLLKQIEAQGREFRCKPIGPIGLFLKIKDRRWSFAVEKCLSPTFLHSFCCDNIHDNQLLRAIMKTVYGHEACPSIIMSKFINRVHDIRANKVQSSVFKTVFDMVTSDNAVVVNCLIDQKSVESTLLIEDSSTAIQLMLHNPPARCSSTFTIKGDQIYPDPNYRYYSCKTKPNSYSLLQLYSKREVGIAEDQLASYTQQVSEKKRVIDIQARDADKRNTDIFRLKNDEKEIKTKIFQNDQSVADLQSNANDGLPDITSLNDEMDRQARAKNKLESELEFIETEIGEKATAFDTEQTKKEDADTAYNQKKTQWNKYMRELETVEQKRGKLLAEKQQYNAQITKEKVDLKEQQLVLANFSSQLQKHIEDASKCSARINTRKTQAALESKLKQLEDALREQDRSLNRDEILKNYLDKNRIVEASKKEINSLQKSIERLKNMIDQRRQKFIDIRGYMTLRVHYLFQTNLKSRRFLGRLEFCHDNGTLQISANPVDSKKAKLHKTSNLSGGERSFVTVALLMALSDASEMPFHVLDEYDVFMDETNKNHSMKLMLEKAEEQRKSQFIFLSPLGLPQSAFTKKNIVRIHRMADPERGAVCPLEEEN